MQNDSLESLGGGGARAGCVLTDQYSGRETACPARGMEIPKVHPGDPARGSAFSSHNRLRLLKAAGRTPLHARRRNARASRVPHSPAASSRHTVQVLPRRGIDCFSSVVPELLGCSPNHTTHLLGPCPSPCLYVRLRVTHTDLYLSLKPKPQKLEGAGLSSDVLSFAANASDVVSWTEASITTKLPFHARETSSLFCIALIPLSFGI